LAVFISALGPASSAAIGLGAACAGWRAGGFRRIAASPPPAPFLLPERSVLPGLLRIDVPVFSSPDVACGEVVDRTRSRAVGTSSRSHPLWWKPNRALRSSRAAEGGDAIQIFVRFPPHPAVRGGPGPLPPRCARGRGDGFIFASSQAPKARRSLSVIASRRRRDAIRNRFCVP
jgi:hypothetical protein